MATARLRLTPGEVGEDVAVGARIKMTRRARSTVGCALLLGLLTSLGTAQSGCESYQEPLPRRDRLNFPIGLEIHPNGRYLYVVNANFDARYDDDLGGTVSVVDTQDYTLKPQATPYLPSFGGHIELNEGATKAYVTARHLDTLAVFDVLHGHPSYPDGAALFCLRPDVYERYSREALGLEARPEDEGWELGELGLEGWELLEEEGELRSDPADCLVRRVPDVVGGQMLPADPFGLAVTTIERDGVATDVVALAHLDSRSVTAITFPGQRISAATIRTAALLDGSNQVARRPGTLDFYVTGRNTDRLAIFTPYLGEGAEVEAILARESVLLNYQADAVDARGAAFSPDGSELYVTTRRPDALHIIDTGPAELDTAGGVANELVASIVLPENPSDIAVHQGPDGRTLLYVTCYNDRSVQVIDPTRQQVIAAIELDARPYQVVTEGNTEIRCKGPGFRCRAYVSLFDDSVQTELPCQETGQGCGSVAVIELDPQSPRYHQVIAKIH